MEKEILEAARKCDNYNTCLDCPLLDVESCQASFAKAITQHHDRYGWHDLRKNPDDLPESGGYMNSRNYLVACGTGGVVIYYNVLEYAHGWNCHVMSNGSIYRGGEMHNVIAWREIEPFESED